MVKGALQCQVTSFRTFIFYFYTSFWNLYYCQFSAYRINGRRCEICIQILWCIHFPVDITFWQPLTVEKNPVFIRLTKNVKKIAFIFIACAKKLFINSKSRLQHLQPIPQPQPYHYISDFLDNDVHRIKFYNFACRFLIGNIRNHKQDNLFSIYIAKRESKCAWKGAGGRKTKIWRLAIQHWWSDILRWRSNCE